MSIPIKHRNAEHTDRTGSFTHNLASVVAACHGSDSGDTPDAELDMFSRWIKLSDELLAAGRKARKKVANFRRRSAGIGCNLFKPGGAGVVAGI
jgi:hypothetical protein